MCVGLLHVASQIAEPLKQRSVLIRRSTRLSNGFSRKLENNAAAVALNYFAYNFIKIHRTLRISHAMAAGVTDRLRDVSDLVALWRQYERRAEKSGIKRREEDSDMKWIYHIEQVQFGQRSVEAIADELDELGEEGWEAVSALPVEGNSEGVVSILFKKSK